MIYINTDTFPVFDCGHRDTWCIRLSSSTKTKFRSRKKKKKERKQIKYSTSPNSFQRDQIKKNKNDIPKQFKTFLLL